MLENAKLLVTVVSIKEECKALIKKANKLHEFKGTEDFYKLPREHKDLIYQQSRLMDEYIQVLGKRMELLKITNFYEFKERK